MTADNPLRGVLAAQAKQHQRAKVPIQLRTPDGRDWPTTPVSMSAAATQHLGTAPGVTVEEGTAVRVEHHTTSIDLAKELDYSEEFVQRLSERDVPAPVIDPNDPLLDSPPVPASLDGVRFFGTDELDEFDQARPGLVERIDPDVSLTAVVPVPVVEEAPRDAARRERVPAEDFEDVEDTPRRGWVARFWRRNRSAA